MKKYVLIAGVNGAGKSTLFHLLDSLMEMPRINTDEIVREFGKWDNPIDVMKAGKIAIKKINDLFDADVTFNQETTLCGNSILKNIRKAKSKDYYVEIHYVGVDSVDIAKQRVKLRVEKGGHGIPELDIERRYNETFENLKRVLNECDQITLYDNTTKFRRFAVFQNGDLKMLSNEVPQWFKYIIE